jgi:hypothetical protein
MYCGLRIKSLKLEGDMKFKELKDKKHSFFVSVLMGRKLPWVSDFLKVILSGLLFTFKNRLRKSQWGSNYLTKLIKMEKFEEGYLYGVGRLSEWKIKESDGVFGPVFYTSWWSVFGKTCFCALRIKREDAFSTLAVIVENGPEPKTGFGVSDAYYGLANLACEKNDFETAWQYVEIAIRSDESYGYPYYLRAWLSEKLNKGHRLSDLMLAIQSQPDMKDVIFQDEVFKQSPGLLENLNIKLMKSGTVG